MIKTEEGVMLCIRCFALHARRFPHSSPSSSSPPPFSMFPVLVPFSFTQLLHRTQQPLLPLFTLPPPSLAGEQTTFSVRVPSSPRLNLSSQSCLLPAITIAEPTPSLSNFALAAPPFQRINISDSGSGSVSASIIVQSDRPKPGPARRPSHEDGQIVRSFARTPLRSKMLQSCTAHRPHTDTAVYPRPPKRASQAGHARQASILLAWQTKRPPAKIAKRK
ncbi:hypothetical protein B0T19DRAFT_274146 [Cercophora scortea]|uniref:Uncharacterized protein n=1 Tax=Cercophora scortea TaxID=314031 RepID=A0AAE0M5M6_9PEZI|nr:hypothetical protein B0T19DRAFT_274146 [Cercophora scortea]